MRELHARYVECPDCGGTGTIETIIGSPAGNPPERVLKQCERCVQFEGYVRDGGWRNDVGK